MMLLCAVSGYAVGCLNPAYLIARRKGFDIRSAGSGNAGGSNALITMGKGIGIFCMLFDILKAIAVILLWERCLPGRRFVYPITAVSVVAGHCFPFYLKFRGGKGLASLSGSVLAFLPIIFGVMLALEALLLFASDYLCLVPITASVVFPFLYGFLTRDISGACVLLLLPLMIVYRHRVNLKRIRKRTELRFSYLWKKEEETARITGHDADDSTDTAS